ncbi:CBS domain-containing protein [Ferviditalea candida]|uniref:CBS domain-containing protein n=1 Tax=Ferviditalea candida TaxID=3108399 RepID=A0ABU5ZHK1_9BACL|nr:CBS domain-containing protein [Paenibacillaceae bacterium T2]
MNIAFFLVPKNEVVCLSPDSTIRQALERMEYHRFSAVPLLDQDGRYVGTITEGDLLWKLKNTAGLSFESSHKAYLKDVPQRMHNKPVHVDSQIEDLISLAKVQNFVPVIDDKAIFIGIIRRSDIIDYCAKLLFKQEQK